MLFVFHFVFFELSNCIQGIPWHRHGSENQSLIAFHFAFFSELSQCIQGTPCHSHGSENQVLFVFYFSWIVSMHPRNSMPKSWITKSDFIRMSFVLNCFILSCQCETQPAIWTTEKFDLEHSDAAKFTHCKVHGWFIIMLSSIQQPRSCSARISLELIRPTSSKNSYIISSHP